MTVYSDEAAKKDRRPFVVVELIMDRCSLEYGIPPCTAPAAAAGQKCYNTKATTRDLGNYNGGGANVSSFFFASPQIEMATIKNIITGGGLVRGPNVYPFLIGDPAFTPAKIQPGQGIGPRGGVSVTIGDFRSDDTGEDKYLDERVFNPEEVGTFWTKFLARNQFYVGRQMNVYTGFLRGAVSIGLLFQKREYIIESIKGPTAKGTVTITGKDILKLAEDKKAQAPFPSQSKLLADLSIEETSSFEVDENGDDFPLGLSTVRINDEVIGYFNRVGNVFNNLTRGEANTERSEHTRRDTVQDVAFFFGNVKDVMQELLEDFAGISPARVNAAGWDPEGWLDDVRVRRLVTQPVGVTTLIKELTKVTGSDMWWDEINQVIDMTAIGPALPTAALATLDESANIIADSVSRTQDPNSRLSQVWIYYAQRDPTQANAPENYQKLYVAADLASEGDDEYQSSSVLELFSPWFDDEDDGLIFTFATRLLQRLNDPLDKFKLAVDVKDSDKESGDKVLITTKYYVDEQGNKLPFQAQLTSVSEKKVGTKQELQATRLPFSGRYAFVAPDATLDYNAAPQADRDRYGFIGAQGGADFGAPNFGKPYKII